MKTTYVYDRLPLTLKRLWLYKLLSDETQFFAPDPLELLSLDLTAALSETNDALILDLVREEYCDLAQHSSLEPDLNDVQEELDDLIRFLITLRWEYQQKKIGRLIAIHFQLPDCVILEYRSEKDNAACQDTSSRLFLTDTGSKMKSFATLMKRSSPKNV